MLVAFWVPVIAIICIVNVDATNLLRDALNPSQIWNAVDKLGANAVLAAVPTWLVTVLSISFFWLRNRKRRCQNCEFVAFYDAQKKVDVGEDDSVGD